MKTQISQFPATLHASYSGVHQQQGRMITDADWNALTAVTRSSLTEALSDVIGSGTPEQGGIIETNEAGEARIIWGDVYVDGIRAELSQDPDAAPTLEFDFASQADFPQAVVPPTLPYRLYLDVWDRSLTALEEPHLLEPALHGADTSTRTRTMAQMKWAPVGFQAEDPDINPPIGEGRLSLTLRAGLASPDTCEPCLDEIEVDGRVGNYAFRVEIHRVERDNAGMPQRVVLKWSRENGAEAARIGDEPPGFQASDWVYEFYSSAAQDSLSESHHGYHHPDVLAAGFTPAHGELTEGFPDAAPAGFDLVRRWDGYVDLIRNGAVWEMATTLVDGDNIPNGIDRGQRLSTVLGSDAHGHFSGGASIEMALDTIRLTLELADHQHLAGDYWMVAVRETIHSAGDALLTDATPDGIWHHYMCVADVAEDGITLLSKGACKRFEFPSLTNIHAEDVCYDNSACEMPGVGNVQEALDHLCQQKDLKWHNKHLHGWGIVCGLIVECCDGEDQEPRDDGDDVGLPRDCVNVTKGYAINCEGEDIILEERTHVDIIDDVRRYDADNPDVPILDDGNGTACLTIGLNAGQPEIRVEPHEANDRNLMDQILDGTLLGDFIQHCVLDMIEALSRELSFLEDGQLPSEDGKELVSQERRKLISFANLVQQIIQRANGSYVWLSRREYDILRELYEALTEILGSKTFCAMFADTPFPPYPFDDTRIDTWFGADNHTRIKLDPVNGRAYTYGAADNNIHVYDIARGELVEIIQMNAAEGAEVTAIAISPDGSRLYAAASVNGTDSVFGMAQTGDKHVFERPMIVLCDVIISEMEVAENDIDLIYAIGLGRGVFFLRPEVLRGDEQPKPDPVFDFHALGHMVIDPVQQRAYATATPLENAPDDGSLASHYDHIAIYDLNEEGGGRLIPIRDINNGLRRGSDDLAIRPVPRGTRDDTQLYVVVDGLQSGNDKEIITLVPDADGESRPVAQIAVEDTQIALTFDTATDTLYAAFEDSYRLQSFEADGAETRQMRIPVQLAPTDVVTDGKGNVYTVNFLSSTVTFYPAEEVELSADRLTPLATVRWQILLTFYALVGNLFQYLKDCLCHHLLIKCPECDGDEKIYLACVEIRDGQVYNICNFGKRKYVQTFMAWNYWLSIIPIGALLKQAIARSCCAVLPNFLDRFVDDVVAPPPAPEFGAQTGVTSGIRAKTARGAVTTYKRTDFGAMRRRQTDKLNVYRGFAGDSTVLSQAGRFQAERGLRKEVLTDARTDHSIRELERAGITDIEVRSYDPGHADRYAVDFAATPTKLKPGSKVVLYERDGKTAFIAEERSAVLRGVVMPSAEDEAKLAAIETRVAAARDTTAAEAAITDLETRRTRFAAEVSEMESSVAALKQERAAEEARIEQIRADRDALQTQLSELNDGLDQVAKRRETLRVEVDSLRPISDLDISARDAERLGSAGIRTIGDLANANTTRLRTVSVGRNTTERNRIINMAKTRLR